MVSEAQRNASRRYVKSGVVQKQVRFYPAERDILEWCEGCGEPFSTYVKRLIREGMEASGGNEIA